eukprot:TRINITY_DN72568_c0_g1_i1.p1 TRINITY_DN72568_c0_g1~~TRINITY_DN72568_c0_g1_i1.p1  ORF type:complete len:483 (+),score=102.95 TRINITY_DN72568_c0_g1_i1:72-1451(+)
MAYTGIVTSFSNFKNYGFIKCDQLGTDVFFTRKQLPEEVRSCSGELKLKEISVQMELEAEEQWKNGKPVASKVYFCPAEGAKCYGSVKSFNPNKGFGFVSTSVAEQDFFFGRKDIPPELNGAELKGHTAGFKIMTSPEGKLQATELFFPALQAPLQGQAGPMQQMPMMQMMAQQMGQQGGGQRLQGVVVSYNHEKGFGFAKSPAVSGDLFFKGNGSSYSPGATITFNLFTTPDGKPQARDVAPGYGVPQMQMQMPVQAFVQSKGKGKGFGEGKGKGKAAGKGKGPNGQDYGGFVGTCVSYNPEKGFGFFQVPGMADVFFKKDYVVGAAYETDFTGKTAQLVIRYTPDGKAQASEVYLNQGGAMQGGVKRPMQGGAVVPPKRQKGESYDGGGPFTGTIATFNPNKGFGFISSNAAPSDVFFSSKILPPALAYLDHAGKSVSFHLSWTPDGKPQASHVEIH